MKVVVASKNPVKINAVKEVFSEIFGDVEVYSKEVDSGVPNQPFNEETIKGAINRAEKAMDKDFDFSVGIEGGIIKLGDKYYNLGFIAILDKNGNLCTGTSGWFECPEKVLKEIKKGKELGQVMDEFIGEKDVKKKQGAIGVFTKGKVTRKELYKHGIYMALCRFLNKEVFE
ncbi:MAG: inosine/xanthosine triphosphatase [Nanoarchaeota archaeon]|nr:inosine/xanthosine triphosphatase [Nanoarchaeota archaeon]